jgi:hypothetical protein
MRVDLGHGPRLAPARLVLAYRGAASSDGGPLLPEGQVEAVNAGGMALPAAGRPPLRDRLQRAAHDAGLHVDQAPAPPGLPHWRLEALAR